MTKAAEQENRVRELLAEAEAAIATGKKAPANSMHMERGVWVRDDKHVRTRNACRGWLRDHGVEDEDDI